MKMNLKYIIHVIEFLALCNTCTALTLISPAFGRPLILGDAILVYHIPERDLLMSLDRNTVAIQWKIRIASPVQDLILFDANRVIAVHSNNLSLIDIRTGKLLKGVSSQGDFLGHSPSGNIFSYTEDGMIICQDFNTEDRVWGRQCHDPCSSTSFTIVDELVFLSSRPRIITTHYDDESDRYSMSATNMIICLSAKDGSVLWEEALNLNKSGWRGMLDVISDSKWLLCATDNVLRLLDKKSGNILRQWHSEEVIIGADFWSDGRIAICLKGREDATKTIRIMNLPDFKLISEFVVKVESVATVDVVKNVMILKSLFCIVGVDLEKKKIVWRKKGQRWVAEYDGRMYYGASSYRLFGDEKRIVGISDPKTGVEKVLYYEKVYE